MTEESWYRTHPELPVHFDEDERQQYLQNKPSIYYDIRWNPLPLKRIVPPGPNYFAKAIGGKSKYGEFPLVVVREHFRRMGFTVWASEPRLFNPKNGEPEGYAAMSYAGARIPTNANHHAYLRMFAIFGDALVQLNKAADATKIRLKGNPAGGDPDLFVFRPNHPSDRFFVEVKHKDQLTPNELTCFPLLEKYLKCEVQMVRIFARKAVAASSD